MRANRKRRLTFIGLLLAGVVLAAALILYALSQNINLYYTPSQLAQAQISPQALIRVGGMVMDNSVSHADDSLRVTFRISDFEQAVVVEYEGVLPNLFREGQGVVVQGYLSDGGQIKATEVLAKHDEKYMPPDITSQEVS